MGRAETEWKFDVDDHAALPTPPGIGVLGDRDLRLEAVYWDTTDLALLSWGATLRHRSASDGSELGWTLKLPGTGARGAVTRAEIRVDGGPDAPPPELLGLTSALTMRATLRPVATVITERRAIRLGAEVGAATVELVDDRVESTVGSQPGPTFRQVEVEIVDPSDEATVTSVLQALRVGGFDPSIERSKLARVLQAPRRVPYPVPKRLPKEATTGDFLAALIGSATRQLISNDPAVRIGEDPEGVHQARVATRRLRSDIKTFRRLMDPDEVESLRRELGWLGELLGGVRDGQVLVRNLGRFASEVAFSADGLTELNDRATGQVGFRRTLLMSALNGERYFALLARLARLAVAPPLREGRRSGKAAAPIVTRMAHRRWRRVEREVADLGSDPSDEDLHEFRKHVKQLRYAAQSIRLVGADSKRFVRALGRLQDALGEHHDAVVAMSWLSSEAPQLSPRAAFLAGQLHQVAQDQHRRLSRSWRSRWSDAAAIPFA